ncbi:hypothetical protein P8825_15055 [Shouchella clausii]|uniref:hypothetical protein n=1 Tax=Shouchella clausii TaxID=79880 RepID=UPI002DB92FDB|nr:hypothetical protein [Shouchella clausii]MEB5480882.1 hypothetical protein [Shouchella clausii]
MSKQERVEAVNQIIQAIGKRGRGFFSDNNGNYARFVLVGDKRKFLHFLNADGSYVNPYDIRKDRHFKHGGTLWALVQDFKDFILTGSYTNGRHGYGGLFASGWGYSDEEMDEIIALATEVGFLRQAATV